ncbi:Hypothetical_protein [Hexamita inflata]|uniref:Hypothetical_protein n=1 Tax=Hexamita inflata TaxID=28002 RepID=A0AA86V2W8_9EUKA|nr:Hypothetical protein HINF_LOCUS61787 [Hexamita inflata]
MSVLMRRENTLIIEPGSDISKIQIINFILLPNSKKHFEGPPLQTSDELQPKKVYPHQEEIFQLFIEQFNMDLIKSITTDTSLFLKDIVIKGLISNINRNKLITIKMMKKNYISIYLNHKNMIRNMVLFQHKSALKCLLQSFKRCGCWPIKNIFPQLINICIQSTNLCSFLVVSISILFAMKASRIRT